MRALAFPPFFRALRPQAFRAGVTCFLKEARRAEGSFLETFRPVVVGRPGAGPCDWVLARLACGPGGNSDPVRSECESWGGCAGRSREARAASRAKACVVLLAAGAGVALRFRLAEATGSACEAVLSVRARLQKEGDTVESAGVARLSGSSRPQCRKPKTSSSSAQGSDVSGMSASKFCTKR